MFLLFSEALALDDENVVNYQMKASLWKPVEYIVCAIWNSYNQKLKRSCCVDLRELLANSINHGNFVPVLKAHSYGWTV